MAFRHQIRAFLLLALGAGLFLIPGAGQAELSVSNAEYVIEDFHSDLIVNEDGTLDVVETIRINFNVPKRGIIRELPVEYMLNEDLGAIYELEVVGIVRDGENEPYLTTNYSDRLDVRIGDPDIYHTGPAEYVISYNVAGPFLFLDDSDELFWNVTGNAWDAPIENSSASVYLPGAAKALSSACYTGEYGSEETDCEIEVAGSVVSVSGEGMLTAVVGFTKGVIEKIEPEYIDYAKEREERAAYLEKREKTRKQMIALSSIGQWIILFILFLYWLRFGKDPKYHKPIIAEFEPLKGMTPTEMGTVIDNKVHNQDFSAAIVYLAVRGYLRIDEKTEGKKKKRSVYTLHMEKKPDNALNNWETLLLDTIFAKGKDKDVNASELRIRVGYKLEKIEDEIYKNLVNREYFAAHPKKKKEKFIVFGVFMLFLSGFAGLGAAIAFDSFLPLASGLVLAAGLFTFAKIMPQRTKKGVEAWAYAKGFKLFLEKAERYRLKWQEEEGIFEKYLPYAMAFGVADKWSKAFQDVFKERGETFNQPTWYKGSTMTQFNPVLFNRSIQKFTQVSRLSASSGGSYSGSSYRAPTSSGSSSFSSGGGGFSGGGFGGGGGRSW